MRSSAGQFRVDFFDVFGSMLPGVSIIEDELTGALLLANDPWPLPVNAATYTISVCLHAGPYQSKNL